MIFVGKLDLALLYPDTYQDTSHLHAVRAAWSGLPTVYKDVRNEAVKPLIRDTDVFPDCPVYLDLNAGFALTDPSDPRYMAIVAHREQFGHILHTAALLLRDKDGGEDHIDAVLSVIRAMDVHLLEYALSRSNFTSLQKNYSLARE
jgi:proteasome activator subunit 4